MLDKLGLFFLERQRMTSDLVGGYKMKRGINKARSLSFSQAVKLKY